MEHQLDKADYAALIEARVRAPDSLQSALKGRRRRELVGDDGNLLIVAVDHTARGMLAAGSDPLAVADRYTLLDRVMRAAMYTLTPHNYVALCLANRFRGWKRVFVGLAGIQVIADLASCGALAALLDASL